MKENINKEATYQIDLIDRNSIVNVSQGEIDGITNHKQTFPNDDLYFHKEFVGEGEDCKLKTKTTFGVRISEIQSICPKETKLFYTRDENTRTVFYIGNFPVNSTDLAAVIVVIACICWMVF